jgi:hypothetical protein
MPKSVKSGRELHDTEQYVQINITRLPTFGIYHVGLLL